MNPPFRFRRHRPWPALCGTWLLAGLAWAAAAQGCPDPGLCFMSQAAKDAWAAQQGCRFEDGAERCTLAWRLDDDFLEESEGALVLEGYIPRRGGEILGASGVTISTGIDLGQQSAAGTRGIIDAYLADGGAAAGVGVDALMATLDPYFGLQREAAAAALAANPLTVTRAEAVLLADAFKHHFLRQIERQFNRRNQHAMEFRRLPEQVQTVIMDFAYQYGLSDTAGDIRRTFWGHVYDGRWNDLADWLESGPDPYVSRRRREGRLLRDAIDNHAIPWSGNPCPGQYTGE